MDYRIGLDVGIASVGWAVLENNSDGEPQRIVNMGSRIFEKAEVPKTGASLAEPRRMARSARRRTRRRRFRKERIKELLGTQKVISASELDQLFSSGIQLASVYQLRTEGLDRLLTNEDWARVLLHLSQRRGYKSNSKAEESADKERGKLLQAIETNKTLMSEKAYRTVGEMLWKDEKFRGYTGAKDECYSHTPRNKAENYANTLPRYLIVDEVHTLFSAQRGFGSTFASTTFEDEYVSILTSQRSFDDGPGAGSPYAGNQIERMLGMDNIFELDSNGNPTQQRAVKSSFTFEYFKLLQDINHIRIIGEGLPPTELTPAQRNSIIALCFKSADIKYSTLRKELGLSDSQRFNTVNYGQRSIEEAEKLGFKQMQSYHKIKKAVSSSSTNVPFEQLSHDDLDSIARILTLYKNDEKRIAALRKAGVDESLYSSLLTLNFSKAGNLSIKSMQKIIPYLEKGLTYDKACVEAYGYHTRFGAGQRTTKLSLEKHCEEITNPVVRRAVSQTIKVVNAIVREYGEPQIICVELARETSKNFDERNKLERQNAENRCTNDRIAEQIEEYKGTKATGEDIVKFKLWNDQKGICLYSGENLDVSRLFEPGYVDVDHIIPYSLCFDNSYRNKVLVKSSENRQKGNRIPAQYLTGERWDKFETLVMSQISDYKKRERLLKKNLTKEDVEGFKERNLNDTKYISRVVYNMLNDNLKFAPHPKYEKHVFAVNGAVTAYVRGRWGINKIRGDGDLHHAVDAVVIACVTDGMINQISRYSQNLEMLYQRGGYFVDYRTGEALTLEEYKSQAPRFPEPWPYFRKELDARLSTTPDVAIRELRLPTYLDVEPPKPLFVSRAPSRKVTGAAHMDTIRSAKKERYTVSKTPLTSLKLKDGEIEGYYNPESDKLLYDALVGRLREFGGDAKKAFSEPFYKPRADGSQGPLVKKVKICSKYTVGVEVNNGVAANGEMVRLDLYHVSGEGYYAVPIYVSDTVKKDLPNKAMTSGKQYAEWKEMCLDNFIFSIYPGDLIKIVSNKGIKLKRTSEEVTGEPEITRKEILLYYVKAGIATASIFVKTHDNRYCQESLGIKTLHKIEKYQVDVLGEYHAVALPEKRIGF